MNRALARSLVLFCIAAFGLACASDRGTEPMAPASDGAALAKDSGDGGGDGSDTQLQDTLAWIYGQSESFTYETVLTLEYTPGEAAFVSGYAPSWGRLYPFSMYVPAGALLPEDIPGDSITLQMRVPILDTVFACDNAPMPIDFGPTGTNFREPIYVSLSQHPNLAPSCTGYDLYYVEEAPGAGYLYGGLQTATSDQQVLTKAAIAEPIELPNPILEPELCKTGILASVDHFSRWNLSQGGGGGGNGSPPICIPCP